MKTIVAILALAAMPVLAAELPRAPTPGTELRGTVTQMETAGWLQAGRALQILDTPIQPAERYTP